MQNAVQTYFANSEAHIKANKTEALQRFEDSFVEKLELSAVNTKLENKALSIKLEADLFKFISIEEFGQRYNPDSQSAYLNPVATYLRDNRLDFRIANQIVDFYMVVTHRA